MKTQSRFLLSKWYLDCVTDDGELFIAYVASLLIPGTTINYSSTLHRAVSGETETRMSLKERSVPQANASTIQWRSPKLDVEGLWQTLAEPVSRVLLETDPGCIEWDCLQPRATAEIVLADGRRIAGLGYVEHLTMSIPPWRLPIDELRWGRFLSPEDALVWIDWRGEKPLNLIVHNGKELETTEITDRGFETSGFALALDTNVIIREGPLVTTALSAIPGVNRLFPLRILGTHESKWLSRGKLSKTGASGWAIHEVVRWPTGQISKWR